MMKKFHYYYFTSSSMWPFMLSLMMFNSMMSLMFFFKFMEFYFLFINFILILSGSFFWWLTFKSEFNFNGSHNYLYESGMKLGMILFISSEVFFFFSFFWSYFHFYLSPNMEVGMIWPPYNLLMFNSFNLPLINTLILLSSGVSMTVSHSYLISSKKSYCSFFLFFTILLGLMFSFFQFLEYNNSFFMIDDSNFGSSFYMLTGFHGIHVIIGFIFLLVVLINMIIYPYSSKSFLSFELSSWYWHFVDVIWMFLFYFLYYIN